MLLNHYYAYRSVARKMVQYSQIKKHKPEKFVRSGRHQILDMRVGGNQHSKNMNVSYLFYNNLVLSSASDKTSRNKIEMVDNVQKRKEKENELKELNAELFKHNPFDSERMMKVSSKRDSKSKTKDKPWSSKFGNKIKADGSFMNNLSNATIGKDQTILQERIKNGEKSCNKSGNVGVLEDIGTNLKPIFNPTDLDQNLSSLSKSDDSAENESQA